jgi:hypothetical protein
LGTFAPFKPPGTRFGFKRDRRKLHIEHLHMPPEVSRATFTDTAKAKQAETTAAAFATAAAFGAASIPPPPPLTPNSPSHIQRRKSLSPPPTEDIIDPFAHEQQALAHAHTHRLGISLGNRALTSVDDEDVDDSKLPQPRKRAYGPAGDRKLGAVGQYEYSGI